MTAKVRTKPVVRDIGWSASLLTMYALAQEFHYTQFGMVMAKIGDEKMLMNMLGFLFGTIFGVWMLYFVVEGAWTGRIHHTDSTEVPPIGWTGGGVI